MFILGAQKKWGEAIELAPPFVKAIGADDIAIKEVIDFCISAAAGGHAQEILRLVSGSTEIEKLEALEVGLRSYLGENPDVAQEIVEVGQDVADRIRELEKKLLNSTS